MFLYFLKIWRKFQTVCAENKIFSNASSLVKLQKSSLLILLGSFQKIYQRYYCVESARVVGTLSNLKAVLHRTNVNGQVKANSGYEAHKDFAELSLR